MASKLAVGLCVVALAAAVGGCGSADVAPAGRVATTAVTGRPASGTAASSPGTAAASASAAVARGVCPLTVAEVDAATNRTVTPQPVPDDGPTSSVCQFFVGGTVSVGPFAPGKNLTDYRAVSSGRKDQIFTTPEYGSGSFLAVNTKAHVGAAFLPDFVIVFVDLDADGSRLGSVIRKLARAVT